MINCGLSSHVYFATPPMPRSRAYLESLGRSYKKREQTAMFE